MPSLRRQETGVDRIIIQMIDRVIDDNQNITNERIIYMRRGWASFTLVENHDFINDYYTFDLQSNGQVVMSKSTNPDSESYDFNWFGDNGSNPNNLRDLALTWLKETDAAGGGDTATGSNQTTIINYLDGILNARLTFQATASKQDTGNTALAAILAKLITTPATAANQATEITQLTAILAKLIATPATEAKQDTSNTALAAINTKTLAAQFNTALPTLTNGQTTGLQVTADGRLITVLTPIRTAAAQQNLTIAAINTAQTAIAANSNRNGFEVFNSSASNLYLNIGGTAIVGQGICILPNTAYQSTNGAMVSTAAISIIGSTIGQNFSVIQY